jgi:enoyl-CoA hydratase/carnithine racemase|tara:strand:+ start:221 stop:1006 length:786 start_codon:yes stop_codon:yes gene_type:complete
MSEILIRKNENSIAILSLNDLPANSLSMPMMIRIQKELSDIDKDSSIRVVIIKSESEKIFCSGHNLKEVKGFLENNDTNSQVELFSTCSTMMKQVQSISKPVIAQVKGIATAAGAQLVASCDLAYGSLDSTYATPGVNIGLFCHTPSVAVSRTVGRKPMMEMLLSGAPISSDRAVQIGLINSAVDASDLDSAVAKACEDICKNSSAVIAMGKKSFYRQSEMPLSDAYDFTSAEMVRNLSLNDGNEGISAFLGKRDPNWTND